MKTAEKKERIRFQAIGALLISLLLAGCYGSIHLAESSSTTTETIDPAAVERGRDLYRENCLSCHGDQARGDGVEAHRFSNRPPDLTTPGLHITTTGLESIVDYPDYSPQAMRRRIRHGTADMPEFKNQFSNREITDLISYLKVLRRDRH